MKKNLPDEIREIQEGLMTAVIHLDTMLSLLRTKGIATEEEYYSRLREIRDSYKKSLVRQLPFWNIPTLLSQLDRIGSRKENGFLSTKIPEAEKPALRPISDEISEIRRFARISAPEGGKVLPCKIRKIDGKMVCDDPESAKKICSSCIAQNMELLPSLGVRDICSLPEMLKKTGHGALKGINLRCWMFVIAEKILTAAANGKIRTEDIAGTMIQAAENIDVALEQEILPEGIVSIIDCAILEAHPEEIMADDAEPPEKEKKSLLDYSDIDWRH
ncbi:MAG: hypothetical protein AB7S75_24315 [Desulfococcaceae bacterium]